MKERIFGLNSRACFHCGPILHHRDLGVVECLDIHSDNGDYWRAYFQSLQKVTWHDNI